MLENHYGFFLLGVQLHYAINQNNENIILNDIGADSYKITDYYTTHKYVEEAKQNFQDIYERFEVKKNLNAFGGSFKELLAWWYSEMSEDGTMHCCYCGVNKETLRKAFSADSL